ncbi:MAG: hypothetical protein AAF268_14505 [Cyanobacteria bacterium P01_A01_bin.3]
MTSKSPSNKSRQDFESDADSLMDELFRDVEESFSTQTALPDPDGPSANGYSSSSPRSQSNRRSRSLPWGALALGGLAALSGTALWWSYVHLPKRLAILSGHGVASSSLTVNSDPQAANSVSTDSSHSMTNATSTSSNAVSDAVEGVVEDAVETSATAASDLIAGGQSTAITGDEPAIAHIEVDQAEVDRILAATAPPPPPVAYAPPPPAPVAYAPPPPAPAPPPAPDMTLVGIMAGSDGGTVALLTIGNNMRQVAVGETITGGWRVASISDRSVSITNGAQSEVLGL